VRALGVTPGFLEFYNSIQHGPLEIRINMRIGRRDLIAPFAGAKGQPDTGPKEC